MGRYVQNDNANMKELSVLTTMFLKINEISWDDTLKTNYDVHETSDIRQLFSRENTIQIPCYVP